MATTPSGLPERVGDDEDLARFLTQSNQYNSVMIKPSAFLPNPKDRETSVSRHGCEPVYDLWVLGLQAAGSRTLHGAALFKAFVVREAMLEVEEDEPPSRHAVICGWPWNENDPVLQKAKQMEMALVIASHATLIRK